MKLKKAIKVLQKKLETDKEYRRGWIDNIVMTFMDADSEYTKAVKKNYLRKQDKHLIASKAAKNFVKLLRTQ